MSKKYPFYLDPVTDHLLDLRSALWLFPNAEYYFDGQTDTDNRKPSTYDPYGYSSKGLIDPRSPVRLYFDIALRGKSMLQKTPRRLEVPHKK